MMYATTSPGDSFSKTRIGWLLSSSSIPMTTRRRATVTQWTAQLGRRLSRSMFAAVTVIRASTSPGRIIPDGVCTPDDPFGDVAPAILAFDNRPWHRTYPSNMLRRLTYLREGEPARMMPLSSHVLRELGWIDVENMCCQILACVDFPGLVTLDNVSGMPSSGNRWCTAGTRTRTRFPAVSLWYIVEHVCGRCPRCGDDQG